MSENYAVKAATTFSSDPTEPILKSIFQQYERVLIESLVTSFGLDFLIKDQYGGDVDTIHNVRQIGKDDQMTYKNKQNQKAYDQRGEYDSAAYHKDPRYIAKNREISEQKKDGKLVDAYTGEKIAPNGKSDLDHVISAKEIHDDRGRVLAGIAGTDLANSDENLQATNPHTNRTKKADSMDGFLDKHGEEYTPEQQASMRQKDAIARKSYEAKLARVYYTSPKFKKDVTKAAAKVGVGMGARQALGFVFMEMWFAVKEEFQKVKDGPFDLGDFLKAIGRGIKRGFENAKEKYKELFAKFLSGAIAGALSSLTTTLCNIFFTTARNTVRIIRQSYSFLVEAGKVLFINPENYTFGERMRAVVKIIATGASVVVGCLVSEAVSKTVIGQIPIIGGIVNNSCGTEVGKKEVNEISVVGGIVPSFCGAFVSGIMSCTLLYFFDRSELMNKLFHALDELHTIETEINYYRQQADYFEEYAAKLMKIDLAQFKKEVAFFDQIANNLEAAKTEEELNTVLKNALKAAGILIPWKGYESFDQFMGDKNSHLVFG